MMVICIINDMMPSQFLEILITKVNLHFLQAIKGKLRKQFPTVIKHQLHTCGPYVMLVHHFAFFFSRKISKGVSKCFGEMPLHEGESGG